jgi:hypothetical protein
MASRTIIMTALTDCWVKTGGKWQVVASHYSVPYKP